MRGVVDALVVRYESSQRVVLADDAPGPRQWFAGVDHVDEHGDTVETIGYAVLHVLDGLLVVDSVRFKGKWQGRGLEPLLVGMAIDHLGAGRPVELRVPDEVLAERLGFERRDGVWRLDPAVGRFADAMKAVRADVG
ncbi:hypothetical protein [Saccharothrix sp.]|uniref:hypothetical protein n=1 Tax=Saccharothrix sp. TaxID=1873460 RepID=UPI0028119652|nr:hypothetical protein [Saccharothrix sp.]